MEKQKMVVMVLVAMVLGTGCVTNMGPGGASPGLIHSSVTYPNMLNPSMQYRITFDREDIELLGYVEAEATSHWVFLVSSWGDSGYAALLEKARGLGGDGLMNVTIDTKFKSYFIFYASVTTKLTGIAYRYRRVALGTP
jgi:hypothetical protein